MSIEAQYRVEEIAGGFEPQMLYTTKNGKQWVPLNAEGYWLEPDCYSTGEITKHNPMTKEAARQAIFLAVAANA